VTGLSTRTLVPGAPRALAAALLLAAVAVPAHAQSLRGSRASVERMHGQALAHGLHFYATSSGVRGAVAKGSFERLTGNRHYTLKAVSFPYVTEQTRTFVERLAEQYHAECGEPLVVTSALRPAERQPRNSVDLSVHPTGMAVDLRKPTKARCLKWLRTTLLALEEEGVLEATEERRPPHFHVAIFPRQYARYVGSGAVTRLASATTDADAVLAARPALATVAVAPAAAHRPASRRASTAAAALRRHRVRAGDTLWHLARRYDTTVKRLRAVNKLSGSRLRPGQQLLIPGGG
jgi:hypothetical protein